jgi:putative PIN family toxin of toxin-antitoxin system
MRVVLDTCVMVAAIRSGAGAARQLLLAALAGKFTLLASVPLMVEYEAVLTRPEHLEAARGFPSDIDQMLATLAAMVEPVRLFFLWRPALRDPGDEMVLDTAVNGGADLLVTFNVRHFEAPAKRLGIRVSTPAEALRVLRGKP